MECTQCNSEIFSFCILSSAASHREECAAGYLQQLAVVRIFTGRPQPSKSVGPGPTAERSIQQLDGFCYVVVQQYAIDDIYLARPGDRGFLFNRLCSDVRYCCNITGKRLQLSLASPAIWGTAAPPGAELALVHRFGSFCLHNLQWSVVDIPQLYLCDFGVIS